MKPMKYGWMWRVTALTAVLFGASCAAKPEAEPETGGTTAQSGSELTSEQMEKGIGPVTRVDLGPLDAAMAERGHAVFSLKCSACHKANERYVGPALGEVLARRQPEYVMNMILNPAEMVARHPTARDLLAQFMTPMPNQQLTQDEAREVLEYLRSIQTSSGATAEAAR
jgi:cytochrome c551/c552